MVYIIVVHITLSMLKCMYYYNANDYRLESTIQFILRTTNRIDICAQTGNSIISEFGVYPTSVVYVGIRVDRENNLENTMHIESYVFG